MPPDPDDNGVRGPGRSKTLPQVLDALIHRRVYFVFLIFLFFVHLECIDATTELHIGSMFPMEAGSGGWYVVGLLNSFFGLTN